MMFKKDTQQQDLIPLSPRIYHASSNSDTVLVLLNPKELFMNHRKNTKESQSHNRMSLRATVYILFPILFLSLVCMSDIANVCYAVHDNLRGEGNTFLPFDQYSKQRNYHGPIVDIISVGSLLKPGYQDAQQRTFGNHISVRNFYRITEFNDTDSTCATQLTTDKVDRIIDFCKNNNKNKGYIMDTMNDLFDPKRHPGWMCAQKRPIDGLYNVLKQYETGRHTIPDYLFIIDDDTYINMERLLPDLVTNYPSNNISGEHQTPPQPYAIAGCNFDWLKEAGITFPYGGFGTYFNKPAIQRLLQPIYCNNDVAQRDEHSNLNCWRKHQNNMNEKQYFVDGMNVNDLMQQYSKQLPFKGVYNWTNTGFCMHSDHTLSYFINFYHITVPEGTVPKQDRPDDKKTRRRYQYKALVGNNECNNLYEKCSIEESRICHYTQPNQMDELHEQQQKQLITSVE